MIWIFSLDKASACACDNYNDLFQYLLKNDNQFSETDVVSDMGAGQMKQWCLTYCKEHNYVVIENFASQKQPYLQDTPRDYGLAEVTPEPFSELIVN
ncbi:MAG: hypothetical protein K2Y18_04715 [Alphaproteobacteria bacterium]|jgi:hypothetical protein|nr:hypothetical protein [Alphaproteobacteria bacterium]